MEMSWSQLNPFNTSRKEQPAPGPGPTVKKETVVDPNNPNPKPGEGDDPLLKFESLWQPNVDKDGKVIPDSNDDNSAYLPAIDPKKFGELVGKMDFTKSITGEEWKLIQDGGEGAAGALASIINKTSRQAFAASFQAAQKMTEQGFLNAKDRFSKGIPDHVRDLITESGMADSMAIFNDPAYAPLVKQVKDQFLKKFPKATPTQLNAAVAKYFDGLKTKLSGSAKDAPEELDNAKKLRLGAKDADFLSWAGEDILAQLNPNTEAVPDGEPQQ